MVNNSTNINKRNNHQQPAFHPLGDFLNPALALARARFKEITHWAKIGFC
jgi:hypothetical protein